MKINQRGKLGLELLQIKFTITSSALFLNKIIVNKKEEDHVDWYKVWKFEMKWVDIPALSPHK